MKSVTKSFQRRSYEATYKQNRQTLRLGKINNVGTYLFIVPSIKATPLILVKTGHRSLVFIYQTTTVNDVLPNLLLEVRYTISYS